MEKEVLFPSWAEITGNSCGHEFKKGMIVEIQDFFTSWKGVKFFHAIFDGSVKNLVTEADFMVLNPYEGMAEPAQIAQTI